MTSHTRLIMFLFLFNLIICGTAGAQVFTVNWMDDVTDSNPGNGECSIGPAIITRCSLRAAIQEANALPGVDTIILPPGHTYSLTITGSKEDLAADGDLDITDHVNIQTGTGGTALTTIIDADAITERVFDIYGENTIVQFAEITIQNGYAIGNIAEGGGGIRNNGQLWLNNVILRDNSTLSEASGAGLYNTVWGKATLTDCLITNNGSISGGGGIFSGPGTELTIISSDIVGNYANKFGGGIQNFGTLDVYQSTISNNSALIYGGGISVTGNSSMHIHSSTITNNSANHSGGGIFVEGSLNIENSTISGNRSGQHGYGVYFVSSSYPSVIRNCTIALNSASDGNAAHSGGVFFGSSAILTMLNTIIANNSPADCGNTDAFASLSTNNLVSDTSCSLNSGTNLLDINPLLGILADNGGRTLTHLPGSGSPAVNAGRDLSLYYTRDQRNIKRPQGTAFDIGAVEVEERCSYYSIYMQNGKTISICL